VPSDRLPADKERFSDFGVVSAQVYEFKYLVFARCQGTVILYSEELGKHGRKNKTRGPDFSRQHRQYGASEKSGLQSGWQYSFTTYSQQIGSGFGPITLLAIENGYHAHIGRAAYICNGGAFLFFDESLPCD